MNKVEQNIEDVKFIIAQLEHYHISSEDKLKAFREEANKDKFNLLYMLPHPKGVGNLICGREAHDRFFLLAKRYLSTLGQKRKTVKESGYVEILKKEFVRCFLKEGQAISESSTTRMLANAFEKLFEKNETLTHYIPCSIVFSKDPLDFEVGPVRFLHKSQFYELYGDELEAQQEVIAEKHHKRCETAINKGMEAERVATKEQSFNLGNRLVEGVKNYLNHYDWVAIVTIGPCDSIVSGERALLAVSAALNILKLMLSETDSNKIRTGCSPGVMTQRAELIRTTNNELRLSVVSGGYDGNLPGEKWFDIINTEGAFFFQTASKMLDIIIDPLKKNPLCQRFLDALTWYGEAVAEQSSSGKIIKYVAAIERITLTEEKIQVTDRVIKRSCLLCSDRRSKDYEDWEIIFKRVYTCRSDLLHGTISPFDERVKSVSSDAAYASRQLLLRGLSFFKHLNGLEEPKYSTKHLKIAYQELENLVSEKMEDSL